MKWPRVYRLKLLVLSVLLVLLTSSTTRGRSSSSETLLGSLASGTRNLWCQISGRCRGRQGPPLPRRHVRPSSDHLRVQCLPEERGGNSDNRKLKPALSRIKDECLRRGCVFDESAYLDSAATACFFPDISGYSLVGKVASDEWGISATLGLNEKEKREEFLPGSPEFRFLDFRAEFQTERRLRIRIAPLNVSRFEVPISIGRDQKFPTNPLYRVDVGQGLHRFFFKVVRRSTEEVVFDADLPGLVYSEQFVQLAARLPDGANVYGLGENQQESYRHDLSKSRTWVGYTRDQQALFGRDQRSAGANMYGVHPTYTCLEQDGNAHTVLFLNSNAQEWQVTSMPGFSYRTIGGILDVYFFLGPTPADTAKQYTEAVGRYYIPPYWSLGFHLCRFGYFFLSEMRAAVERTRRVGIPQDVQCGDVDIMETIGKNFSVNKLRFSGLPKFVRHLKRRHGVRFMPYIEPFVMQGVGSDRELSTGNALDVWVKNARGGDFIGKAWWLHRAKWPDFTKQQTKRWWINRFKEYHHLLNFDGVIIDLNEPINFGDGERDNGCNPNSLNNPPYRTRTQDGSLTDDTLCLDVTTSAGRLYDVHNLYGWSESELTLEAVREATGGKQRGFVISRSTFVGSGRWVAHWLGDNFSSWDNLRYAIIKMLQFNRFGIPMVGADICGFWDPQPLATSEEMCTRWQQVGAFYPLSRNHNGFPFPAQDPGLFSSVLVDSTRRALKMRYRLLPYLYTLFFMHHTEGSLVVRALWDEFPTDRQTWAIDDQFLWGPALMISPVLTPKSSGRSVYFPRARWYEITRWMSSGIITEVKHKGARVYVDAGLSEIPLYVRGGHILPLQLEALNTERSRRNSWILLVALDERQEASGELFVDDGVSVDTVRQGKYALVKFFAAGGQVWSEVDGHEWPASSSQKLNVIEILGVRPFGGSGEITINGRASNSSVIASPEGRLSIRVNLQMNQANVVDYSKA